MVKVLRAGEYEDGEVIERTTYKYSGITFLQLLGVVFITLKLCGVIDWSWWLVTLPLWIGIAVLLAVLAVVGVVGLFFLFLSGVLFPLFVLFGGRSGSKPNRSNGN